MIPKSSRQATLAVVGLLALTVAASAEQPTLIPDLNFPLIRLPETYESRRSTKRVNLAKGQAVELLRASGPGCVRHFWITSTAPDDLEIEIRSDGAEEPQVRMRMHHFFGVLLDQKPYRIASGPIKLLPRNGYNSYFPIPFQSSCTIVLRNTGKREAIIWSMVNWQKYDARVAVTPHRLHARYSSERPAEPLGSTLLGAIGGRGFVAGMFHAIRRHDHRDAIWHTGGDTWLIDGETSPHVLRGIGVEDIFGHSFGVYEDMNRWLGGAYVVGQRGDTSEVVAYRFFGVDSVAFKSSLVLRFGTRENDIENVLYYYKEVESQAPRVETPNTWLLLGTSPSPSFAQFEREPLPAWKADKGKGDIEAVSERTWIDFTRWYRGSGRGNPGTQPVGSAAHAQTTISSAARRKAVLRLGFSDWMKLSVNDQPAVTLRHDEGFQVAEIPVVLEKGENRLRLKLSNSDNVEWRCWAFSCVIADRDAAGDNGTP